MTNPKKIPWTPNFSVISSEWALAVCCPSLRIRPTYVTMSNMLLITFTLQLALLQPQAGQLTFPPLPFFSPATHSSPPMPINCTDWVFFTGQSSLQQPCLLWFPLIPGTGVIRNVQALRRIPSLGWRAQSQQPLTPFQQNSSHCQLRRMRGDTRRVGAWFGLELCQCTASRIQYISDGRLSAKCPVAQRLPVASALFRRMKFALRCH